MTGDQDDFLSRLRSYVPSSWFSASGIFDAVMYGFSAAWAWLYSMYQYAALQTRIRTATGAWLDYIASDFFGTGLQRMANELDTQYRARILAALFIEKGTRNAIYYTLLRLTGRPPVIFEPGNPHDTGSYAAIGQAQCSGLGYNVAGGYGSMMMAYQALVTVYLPITGASQSRAGYGTIAGGYTSNSLLAYVSLSSQQQNLQLQAIYDAVENVKPFGSIVWVGVLP